MTEMKSPLLSLRPYVDNKSDPENRTSLKTNLNRNNYNIFRLERLNHYSINWILLTESFDAGTIWHSFHSASFFYVLFRKPPFTFQHNWLSLETASAMHENEFQDINLHTLPAFDVCVDGCLSKFKISAKERNTPARRDTLLAYFIFLVPCSIPKVCW